jgi:serralysin
VLVGIADDEIGTFGSGSFMFSKSSFSVVEDDGLAVLTVNRIGGTQHTVSVTYTTSNGSASPGLDYTHTTGTLTFEPGEQSKTFTVPVVSDTVNDSNEYFTVTLSSPTLGSTLESPSSVPVYIYD